MQIRTLSTGWPFITSDLQPAPVNPRLNFRRWRRVEELCETGVVTTTENGCRLLDRDDPSYSVLSRGRIVSGYVVGDDFHTSAFDSVFNALSQRADPYQFKGISARCEHPFDHTCGFGCLVTRTYLKTDRPIKLNMEAMLHRHEHKGAKLKCKF